MYDRDSFTVAGGSPPQYGMDDLTVPDWIENTDQPLGDDLIDHRVQELSPPQLQLFGTALVETAAELTAAVDEYSRKLQDYQTEPDSIRQDLLEDELQELATETLPELFDKAGAQIDIARKAEQELLGDGSDTYAEEWVDRHSQDQQYSINAAQFNTPGTYGQPGTMYGMGDPDDSLADPEQAQQAFRDAAAEAEAHYRDAVRRIGDEHQRGYADEELGIDPVAELGDLPIPRMDNR